MNRCPSCKSTEIDVAGICLVCGFQIKGTESADHDSEKRPESFQGMIAMGYSVNPESDGKNELPEWRKELSKRLKEIRHKRGAPASPEAEAAEGAQPTEPPAGKQGKPQKTRATKKGKSGPSAGPIPPAPAQHTESKADSHASQYFPKDEKPATGSSNRSSAQPPRSVPRQDSSGMETKKRDSKEVRDLIDSMATLNSNTDQAASKSGSEPADVLSTPKEDKLIFISRTFSGLVDLLIVVLSGSTFILAVDIIEGIEIFDSVSLLYYFALLIATFFVYSILFLMLANQTVGMMITDLRVVDTFAKRPKMAQLFKRCAAYLIALLGAGLGLIWGVFDGKNRCLHDRLSGTRVIRVLPPIDAPN